MGDIRVPEYLMEAKGSRVCLQKKECIKGQTIKTMILDLKTGTCSVTSLPPLTCPTPILGVAGLLKLPRGAIMVVVTEAKEVADLMGKVYKVKESAVITHEALRQDATSMRYAALLHDAFNTKAYGKHLYFSHQIDLTRTWQGERGGAKPPHWNHLRKQYMWNWHLAKPVVDGGGASFVLPLIYGFVGQLHQIQFQSSQSAMEASVTLVARTDRSRAGTAFWRHGLDGQGRTANFVETEQILILDAGKVLSSHVQYRGSPPAVWHIEPQKGIRAQELILGKAPVCSTSYDLYCRTLGSWPSVLIACILSGRHGQEGKLCRHMMDLATSRGWSIEDWTNNNSTGPSKGPCRSPESNQGPHPKTWLLYDTTQNGGHRGGQCLNHLRHVLHGHVVGHGTWVLDQGQVVSAQKGIVNSHSLLSVDRVALVQTVVGGIAMEEALKQQDMMDHRAQLQHTFPLVHDGLLHLWFAHHDALAYQTTSQGTLCADVLQSGRSSIEGRLDDVTTSLFRWYVALFSEGRKQDAVDLVTGQFQVSPDGPLPPLVKPMSPLVLVQLALVSLAWAISQVLRVAVGLQPWSSAFVLVHVVLPLCLFLAVLFFVVRVTKIYLSVPQLSLEWWGQEGTSEKVKKL